ncbi:hypothetical protein [Paenibacillus sp. R14(2021)]|uniref:hypothetical protein n=1 Tax=Paenibacillus sp. R14(2021) TaxID=2859228 RepID=UPI001C6151A8|nr:hypothetical protein [Paenibacillus sp. R14(2021)]
MLVVVLLVSMFAMMAVDYKDGVREGPRPTRIKLIYVVLVVLSVYHIITIYGRLKLYTFYDVANAILGPGADSLVKWLTTKG